MFLPSLSTLARTAAIGGFVVIGSSFYFKSRIQQGIKQSEYFKESLRILRSHRGIAYLLGEPIRDGNLDLGDNVNNFCTGKEAQFQKMEKKIHTESSASSDAIGGSLENSLPICGAQLMKSQDEETENVLGNSQNITSSEYKVALETEETESSELNTLSHAELRRYFQGALSQLLQDDPILADLHPQVTLEEVNALIELEHGRAMKVYIEKDDGGFWSIVIPREATVHDLKQGLKHHVALVLSRKGAKNKISWRYIWKTYWLCYNGEKLTDDNTRLLEFGIRNKSTLTFVKKYRERQQFGKRNG
ncbi:uncharacterized protein [Panulirus ornatus]